jgi:hypothetical protein
MGDVVTFPHRPAPKPASFRPDTIHPLLRPLLDQALAGAVVFVLLPYQPAPGGAPIAARPL